VRAPYKAKTISGAERRVRRLEGQLNKLTGECVSWESMARRVVEERDILALLAADKPMFDNPILVIEAKKLRDRVLRSMDTRTAAEQARKAGA